MSHVAKIKVEIKDLHALRAAAESLGLRFNLHQKTYKWYGSSVGDYPLPEGFTAADLGKCNHAISIPGNSTAYEIGVVERNGKFTLLWDFWQGGYGLVERVGKDGQKLIQAYARQVAIKQARAQGMTVTETTREDGTIVLRCRQ